MAPLSFLRSARIRALVIAVVAFGCYIPSTRPEGVWKHPSYQGVVTDARTRTPVAGARVTWAEGRLSAVTDDSGRFALPGDKGARVGLSCFADELQARTITIAHPSHAELRFRHTHVLNGDPVEDLGSIELTPRAP